MGHVHLQIRIDDPRVSCARSGAFKSGFARSKIKKESWREIFGPFFSFFGKYKTTWVVLFKERPPVFGTPPKMYQDHMWRSGFNRCNSILPLWLTVYIKRDPVRRNVITNIQLDLLARFYTALYLVESNGLKTLFWIWPNPTPLLPLIGWRWGPLFDFALPDAQQQSETCTHTTGDSGTTNSWGERRYRLACRPAAVCWWWGLCVLYRIKESGLFYYKSPAIKKSIRLLLRARNINTPAGIVYSRRPFLI